jgi:hypothetical protein
LSHNSVRLKNFGELLPVLCGQQRIVVAQAVETEMRKKVLFIGAIAAAAVVAGGWAFAQTAGHGPGSFAPGHMRGMGGMHGQMGEGAGDAPGARGHGMQDTGRGMRGHMGRGAGTGPGMHGHMGGGMMRHMGSDANRGGGPGMTGRGHGMMGMGGGMMGMGHDAKTRVEVGDIHSLLANHDRIKRTVTHLADGIRTVTESDDPQIAALVKTHVADMGRRVKAGDDPGLPIESPALRAIFRAKDKINTSYDTTANGIVVTQTSSDPDVAALLHEHADEVSDLVTGGMMALHAAMARNNGGMMHGHMTDGGRDHGR